MRSAGEETLASLLEPGGEYPAGEAAAPDSRCAYRGLGRDGVSPGCTKFVVRDNYAFAERSG